MVPFGLPEAFGAIRKAASWNQDILGEVLEVLGPAPLLLSYSFVFKLSGPTVPNVRS